MIPDLSRNEMTVLERLIRGPVRDVPAPSRSYIVRLMCKGLAVERDGIWYPTRSGLARGGRSLH
jgi:hypothetical protein